MRKRTFCSCPVSSPKVSKPQTIRWSKYAMGLMPSRSRGGLRSIFLRFNEACWAEPRLFDGAATGKIEPERAHVDDRALSAARGIPFRGQDHGKQKIFPLDPIPSNRIALSPRARLVKGARRTFPARSIGQDRVD